MKRDGQLRVEVHAYGAGGTIAIESAKVLRGQVDRARRRVDGREAAALEQMRRQYAF